MEKRYQVFISSTYSDLIEERRYIMQALMEMDCIPAGMELFPATDEEQWAFIKKVIDDCDYYLLITGGRYGSTTTDGISYTEKEFDYAVEKGIKVICLLHKNPDAIPLGKSEKDPEMQGKLEKFCEKVKNGRLVKFWEKPEELQNLVIVSLHQTIKRYPAIGYVRANLVPGENATSEILKLRNQINELETQLEYAANNAPIGTEQFAQGDDLFEIHYNYSVSSLDYDPYNYDTQVYKSKIELSWNTIFSKISPSMINKASESDLTMQLNTLIQASEYRVISKKEEYAEKAISEFRIDDDDFQTIKIQLRTLGLITKSTKSTKNRNSNAMETYWRLTPYGDNVMTRIIAIKR